jgi:NADP-dependent 3-hydroxy acid dehydrogenase YdfG
MQTDALDQVAIDAVARAIAYAIEQPAEVDINKILPRPAAQLG